MSLLSLLCIFVDFRSAIGVGGMFTDNILFYIILKIVLGFGFLFFGYIFFFLLKREKKKEDILLVDKNGITANSSALSIGFIPWTYIDKIYINSILGNNFIELVLNNEEQHINKLSGLKRQAVLINKKIGHEIICITLNSTGVFPEKILPDIQYYFQKVKLNL